MGTRIDQTTFSSTPYELYRQDFLEWRVLLILGRKSRVWLLHYFSQRGIGTKYKKVFDQISFDDLKKKDGLDILITFLINELDPIVSIFNNELNHH